MIISRGESKKKGRQTNGNLSSASPVDVVALDYKMPRKNGLDVAK
jgi:CheY-like chemotaxis protein